jgi:hypothetical protein
VAVMCQSNSYAITDGVAFHRYPESPPVSSHEQKAFKRILKPSKPLTSPREALAFVKGFVKGFVNPFSTDNPLHIVLGTHEQSS